MWYYYTHFGFKYMKIIGILWKEIIFYGYLKKLWPLYKPYDYNFNMINFKHKNIGGTSIPPC